MNQDFAVQILTQGIITLFMVSLPIVGVGLIVGFMVSLFQAVTQIQEQTLTFVPKVIAVLAMVALMSPWIISLLVDFTTSLWSMIPALVR
ncbi:flagellar biosynthetic protein FliQ [candidate division WOR-1 bacterium RIFOXYB2_FULL_42_35]|uniref:Flagellar biosynthetic protein FliQ n=1 Tax=candidate division WOR-1 bacterium RIFOXYC2_FULL_41_25 TaxID=1802586 RepID=A0A1F4TIK1_UNCSA|nr:MAG: flagellar biosynthetic protein FliQ [candidate division WOR-1 bacterium RIFOXYA2_FULL_41_14]OGC21564.1 MAG: flagellar biosynthetic protein FliQ [candidate division WOR-1 bacterium RIFOXYB2_FULL_42_35]OGC32542.1 MAG: flagellar biosynthetic protein FliQ [candidate division WOR-1 bacterium RIFOXYC2_FULL_41_25]